MGDQPRPASPSMDSHALLRANSYIAANEDLCRSNSPSNNNSLVTFEVKPRDFYLYYVTVEGPGDLIKWSFYTKKKNIAFGLFYLHSLAGGSSAGGEEALPGGGALLSQEQIKDLVAESRSFASIWPPPPKSNFATASLSRSNSQLSRMATSEGSLGVTPVQSTSSFNASESNLASGSLCNRDDFFKATSAFGQPTGSKQPYDFMEIIPIDKYESYENTINGSFKVPLAGVYVLCFDNSFSINTSKQVFVGLRVVPAILLADHGLLTSELPYVGGGLGALDESILVSGWMMKKKRKKIQGWARRWVQLERSGVLSYYASRNGACRGTIDVRKSSFARNPNRRLITIDSSDITFHLRALTDDDYTAWTLALLSCNAEDGGPRPTTPFAEGLVALSQADNIDLIDRENEIQAKIGLLNQAIADLRGMAAKDDGSLAPFVGPLEQTFSSLDAVFSEICGYSAHLRTVHLGLLRPQRRVQAQPADLEDVFYDLELSDLSEFSEEAEYVDAELFDHELTAPVSLPPSDVARAEFQFRTTLPAPAPPCNISLASILRKSIGKDSSGMVMPMGLNEPLNGLQRLCEELEYSDLLDKAAGEEDPLERLVLIAAFAVSNYASHRSRAERKPFNPMLGETYEYVDAAREIRFVSEKVSHRPLVLACHAASSLHGWEWWQDQKVKTKFWGKSIEYIPSGSVNVRFDNGDHFRWGKVVSCLRNVLGSNKWIENYGEMTIENLGTGHSAVISFKSSGSFFGSSSSSTNEVQGIISDGTRSIKISGRWDDLLMRETEGGRLEVVWRASPFPPLYQEYYGFTYFALRLNQLLPGQADSLPPTDTRLRPDQRMMEEARIQEAEAQQLSLIERQRAVRVEMEAAGRKWTPLWFHSSDDGDSWTFTGEYWEAKDRRDWSRTPTLW